MTDYRRISSTISRDSKNLTPKQRIDYLISVLKSHKVGLYYHRSTDELLSTVEKLRVHYNRGELLDGGSYNSGGMNEIRYFETTSSGILNSIGDFFNAAKDSQISSCLTYRTHVDPSKLLNKRDGNAFTEEVDRNIAVAINVLSMPFIQAFNGAQKLSNKSSVEASTRGLKKILIKVEKRHPTPPATDDDGGART